jgi:hypothetical protein
MANCHFNNVHRNCPAAVVTDLDGNIIIGNSVYEAGKNVIENYSAMGDYWVVSGAKAMITRFFSAANCSVILVPHIPNQVDPPSPLPKEIDLEREFQLWLGYLDFVRPVVKQDLEDNFLLPVFTGVIENIKSTASSTGGYTIQIQARDRVKWLMDSSIFMNSVMLRRAENLPRSELIWQLALRAVGIITEEDGTSGGCNGCGKKIDFDSRWSIDLEASDMTLAKRKIAPANYFYTTTNLKNDPYPGDPPLQGRTTSVSASDTPLMRIHTTRVALKSKSEGNFLLADQTASEAIKVLSFQEVYPMEFFQDHRDGNFYYVPRANDISGLSDSERFNRTYYFKVGGEDTDVNQRLLALREERSSIGMKTNIIVGAKSSAASDNLWSDNFIHLKAKPHTLKGVPFACKFSTVVDPSISSLTEAGLIAFAHARIWSRETQAGMMSMLGDPSLTPGEIIQLVGSPLLPKEYLDEDILAQDKQKFLDYELRWNEYIKDYTLTSAELHKDEQYNYDIRHERKKGEAADNEPTEVPADYDAYNTHLNNGKYKVFDDSELELRVNEPPEAESDTKSLFCTHFSSIRGEGVDGDSIGFNTPPRTMFRIEAIVHKFNQGTKGYTTEVALVTPF